MQARFMAALARFDTMAWLRPDLARLAAWGLLIGLATVPLGWMLTAVDGIRHTGVPLAGDFTAFWSAATLAVQGRAAAAYDPAVLHPVQLAAFGGRDFGYLGFFYPPTFLMAVTPLGLLSRGTAALVFLLLSLFAYVVALRPLLPKGTPVAALLAFPGVLVCLDYGQNGLLTAALFGAAVTFLDRRPALAGICFGLLTIKPQLGPLIPIALAVAGRWTAFASAAVTALLLAGVSALVLGLDAWVAFFASMALARDHLEGLPDYTKFASLFAIARLAGLPPGLAHGVQLVFSTLPALVAVIVVAWRRPGGRAEGAVLVAATPLATAFFYEYEVAMLAIPMAWMLAEGMRAGFRPGEKSVLLLSFFAPLVSGLAHVAGNLFAFAAGAALLAFVTRRALDGAARQ